MFAIRPKSGVPYVVGHRGARAHAPENTLLSFRRGVELGADLLECDVHLSRDGVPVVIHDETLNRTTDQEGRVHDLTFNELRAVDAGRGERIMSLGELLDWIQPNAKLGLAVEIKGGLPLYPKIADVVTREVLSRKLADRVVVISFERTVLGEVKRLAPTIATGMLYFEDLPDPSAQARACGADAVMPPFQRVTPALVSAAHAAGLGIYTWTVNEPADIERMLQAGVDGITSDRPDEVRARIQAAHDLRA